MCKNDLKETWFWPQLSNRWIATISDSGNTLRGSGICTLLPGAASERRIQASGGFQSRFCLFSILLHQANSSQLQKTQPWPEFRTPFSAHGVGILSAWAPKAPNRYFENFKNSQSPVVRIRVKSSFLLFVLTTYSYDLRNSRNSLVNLPLADVWNQRALFFFPIPDIGMIQFLDARQKLIRAGRRETWRFHQKPKKNAGRSMRRERCW